MRGVALTFVITILTLGGHPAIAQTSAPPVTAGWQDGFVIQSANGDFKIQLGMVAQVDGRFAVDDPDRAVTDSFVLRKLRPTLTGRVSKYFDFKFMPDLGNGATIVQDAYIDVRFSTALRVRAGKDKTPVGLELLQGDAYVLFPERALASSLVPNRDVGFEALGDLANGRLSYQAGVFNGVADGASSLSDVDPNGSKDLAGRIAIQPFRTAPASSPWKGLGFALGGSTGRQAGALPSFKTSVQQTYFSYDRSAVADGVRTRVSPSVFYYYKAFGGFAEYVRSSQPVTRGIIHQDVANDAWEATGSYVVTGKASSDRGVRPARPFDPAHGSWGALQLLARVAALTIDPLAFDKGLADARASRGATSFTIGANWYPTAYMKYYMTFERTTFERGFSAARHPENAIQFRVQVAF